MKGLILKDFIMTWKYCKSFLFLMAVFIVASVFVTINSFMTVYPIVLASMLPFTICAYDERSRWNIYCDALPITRKSVVVSKYLYSLICIALIISLIGVSLLIRMQITDSIDTKELFTTISLLLAVAFVSPGFMLPFMFKYNVEKARIAYFVTIGIVCGLSAILSINIDIPNVPVVIALAVAVVLFAGSCAVSIKLYEKREL